MDHGHVAPTRQEITDETTLDDLIARYLAGPALVSDTIAGMGQDQLHARPIEGKMTTHEVVTHIVDSEGGLGGRISRALAGEEVPLAQGMGGHPESKSEPERDLEAEVGKLATARQEMASKLRGLSADAWELVAIRREERVMSVRQVLVLMVRHLENHVVAIEEKKAALGL